MFYLREADATVTATVSAGEAMAAYERETPDVIVSDIGLPHVDGYELITQIRAREKAAGRTTVPGPALTVFATDHNQSRAIAVGFQQCLGKPVEPPVLVAAIASIGWM